ncbi:hypothetical protein O6H91_10G023900 [Diphasiastrum complanatum]|uniref:Uncharacterized protein n=1 Tax=Diphasiastrum complanatum TaxID=34168 RepID=A0ACC2CF75_DIPCM|nr:hypothetical protein O6H91_10G023900 [Diphasiastrum complanatum]
MFPSLKLGSTNADVDETVRTMVKLIKGTADFFAQRAEDYYQKLLQLVKEVENLYRAYRSLADHYDQLVGNVCHNLSKALQTQYGPTCDYPRSSPLGKQLPLTRRSGSLAAMPRDFDSPQSEYNRPSNGASNLDDRAYGDMLQQQNGNMKPRSWWGEHEHEVSSASSSDVEHESRNQGDGNLQHSPDVKVHDKGLTEDCKRIVEDFQEEKIVLLQQEQSKVPEDNGRLGNEMTVGCGLCQNLEDKFSSSEKEEKDLECEFTFEVGKVGKIGREVGCLQDDNMKKEREIPNGTEQLRTLQEKIVPLEVEKRDLEDEVSALAQQEKSAMTSVRFLTAEVSKCVQRNKKDSINQKKLDNLAIKEKDLEISRLNHQIEQLIAKVAASHEKLLSLEECTYKQKSRLAELSEEKREAIRQLCFTIDVMKDRGMMLEEAVGLLKKKVQSTPSCVPSVTKWKSLLAHRWARLSLQPFTLAL